MFCVVKGNLEEMRCGCQNHDLRDMGMVRMVGRMGAASTGVVDSSFHEDELCGKDGNGRDLTGCGSRVGGGDSRYVGG